MSLKGFPQRLLFPAAALLILAASGQEGVAEVPIHAGKSPKIERSGRVLRYILNNGLTVIMEENRFSPVVALMVYVKAGSAVEEIGEYGLAHVHEHMLFKGTKKRGVGRIAGEIEAGGGDINAYTSLDETVYYIVIPSRHTELGLDVLSDAMFHSSFDPGELDKELQVVIEEIRRGRDTPKVRLSHALLRTTYKVHPYGRPIIGTEESVRAFTRRNVLDFYRKWYTPGNMVLVAVGDFDAGNMMDLIGRYFGTVKLSSRKRAMPSRELPPEPRQRKPRFAILRGDVTEGYLEIAFHIPSVCDDDIPALDVLSYIFGTGESSILYRKVQSEKGLVHSIHSYTFTPRDPGLAIVGATLDPKKTGRALEAILTEMARLKSYPPGTEEISRAKTNIESEAVYSRETVQGEARKLGFYEVIAGDIGFEEKYLRAVDAVSAEDIMAVARKYFTSQNITVTALLPDSTAVKGLDKASLEVLVRKALDWKPAISPVAGVKKVVLSNGLTVLIKEQHGTPVVAYRMAMLGGVRLDPPKRRGISAFIARTIGKGTAKRSATEIAAEVESMAGSIGGFSGRDSVGVQAEFLSKHFIKGFDLFVDVALNPTFPSKEVEQQRREIIGDIGRLMDRPDSLTVDTFRRNLFRIHPYGTRILGEKETVAQITRRHLVEHYRKLLVPSNMVLAVVGDVSAAEILPRVKRYFNDVPARPLDVKFPPKEPPLRKIKKVEIRRDKAQVQIVLGFLGPSLRSKDRYSIDVLATILGGQGGRLFVELRDRLHLAYAVGAVSVEALDAGIFFLYMGTKPENRDEAVNGLMEEIERIRREPPSLEEIERAREYVAGSYEIGMQTSANQAVNLALNELYGLGWKENQLYAERIRRVSPEDVWNVARKYLHTDKYVIAELLPLPEGNNGNDD